MAAKKKARAAKGSPGQNSRSKGLRARRVALGGEKRDIKEMGISIISFKWSKKPGKAGLMGLGGKGLKRPIPRW